MDVNRIISKIIDRLSIRPPEEESNPVVQRLFVNIPLVAIVSSIILLIFSIVSFFNAKIALATLLFSASIINALNYFFLRWTRRIRPSVIVSTMIIITLYSYLMLTGGLANTGLYWCFVFSPILFYALGHRYGMIACSITALITFVILANPDFPGLTATYSAETSSRFPITFFAVSLLLYVQELGRYRADEKTEVLQNELEEIARTDSLSGLVNRRGADEILNEEERRGKRSGKYGIVMLADIDYFKRINDSYGHEAGDSVIQFVANELRSVVRDIDTVARWGGEEFMILFVESDIRKALKMAERVRANIESQKISYEGQVLSTTISIGVAVFNSNNDVELVLRYADEALYRAKENGRNQVVLAEESGKLASIGEK